MSSPLSSRRLTRPALAAATALISLLAACSDVADPEGTPRRIAREIESTLTTVAQNELVHDPELATELGLPPEQAGYPFNRFLTDRSQAAFERARLDRLETLDVLVRTSRPATGSALANHLDTAIAAHEAAETVLVAGHGTGNLSAFYPYVADHIRGAYLDVPELLVRRQPMQTPEDASAFLERAAQLPGTLDDERRRLEADAQAGVTPPRPVLERMQAQAAIAAAALPDTSFLIVTFEGQLDRITGLKPQARRQLSARMRALLEEEITPAYARLAASTAQLATDAPGEPGVWQIRGGDAYYEAILAAYTGTRDKPADLRAGGETDVAALTNDLGKALGALGLTEGTLGERLGVIALQPGQIYEDSDIGRAALIERLTQLNGRARFVVNKQIGGIPSEPVSISVVPAAFAQAAPPSAYAARTADGRVQARFEINLTRMSDWPDYRLPTLVFHETIPGHHLRSLMASSKAGLPLARRLISNSGFSDGWAAYAETLAFEGGLYTEDPLGRIGYLQSMLLRAARLVVDTGIHEQKWTRDRAVAYIVSVTGLSPEAARDEVDRCSVWPGDGAAGWIGRQRILDLRERAQRVLGPRFDPKVFHAVILNGGPRPLDMVEADVTRWYTELAR